jgi:hypothetical protein
MAKDKQNKGVSEKSQSILHPMGLKPYPFFKRFMTLPEAAFYTGQAESSIKRAVYDGELAVIQRGERSKWVLDVLDLDLWMLQHKKRHRPVDTRMRTKDGKFK